MQLKPNAIHCRLLKTFLCFLLLLLPLVGSGLRRPAPFPAHSLSNTSHTTTTLSNAEVPAMKDSSPKSVGTMESLPPAASPSNLGHLLLVYGGFTNDTTQEPTDAWEGLFGDLGYMVETHHISNIPSLSTADVVVVLPSVGLQNSTFGVTYEQAQNIVKLSRPTLLLGYAHEVLDQLFTFNPDTDFIICTEKYLWTDEQDLQIFQVPNHISETNGQIPLYSDHISYDAYRINRLPDQASVLGSNFGQTGVQLLWIRALTNNTHLYYWGIDQTIHLNSNGRFFLQNLLLWLQRPPLSERFGGLLAEWQLATSSVDEYWAIQGVGGYGYPLEPSIPNTYYVSDLVITYSLPINLSTVDDWLRTTCYNNTLGCFEDLASPQYTDRCITTSMAIIALSKLNQLTGIDLELISDYIASSQDAITGGFYQEPSSAYTSLKATRYALTALNLLGHLQKINITLATEYIRSCQELDIQSTEYGGFYATATGGFLASLPSSLDAIEALTLLSQLETINQSALLMFLANCEESGQNNVFDTQYTFDSDEWIFGTACALRILQILDKLELYNSTISRNYLLSGQFPNGGWGRGDTSHDFHNTPDETWYAIQGLEVTGGLGLTTSNLTSYLLACCTHWGGITEPQFFGDLLTGWYLLSALSQVGGLKYINQTAFLDYLKNCWVASWSSFSWHQVPEQVSANTDLPTPDRTAIECSTFGPLYHYIYSILTQILALQGPEWTYYSDKIKTEIQTSQTLASGYEGMFGPSHHYVGQESNITFRFDGTCWSLIAHQNLGGTPSALMDSTAALTYLQSCLQDNGSYQYFHDLAHHLPPPLEFRVGGAILFETWLGLQAYGYLEPSLSTINETRIATFVLDQLTPNCSLLTSFLVTDILRLLAEFNLLPDALALIDRNQIKEKILQQLQYNGLVHDSQFETQRWVPQSTHWALSTAHILDLLPHLDLCPQLQLSILSSPLGLINCGDNLSLQITITELHWDLQPENLTITSHLFNTTFSNFIGPDSQNIWSCNLSVPTTAAALGPQNLAITAHAHQTIPDTTSILAFCEVWSNLTIATIYDPGHQVLRSLPLNLTVQVTLQDGNGTSATIDNALAIVTNYNTTDQFILTYQSLGNYRTELDTTGLVPGLHQLNFNITAPYCTPYTELDQILILVKATTLDWQNPEPTTPIVFEPSQLSVQLRDSNNTILTGYFVQFNLTKPGDSIPSIFYNNITDSNGIALITWTPSTIGQWIINYQFSGQNQYSSTSGTESLIIYRRTLSCILHWSPPPAFYVGNLSFIGVTVTDELNGTHLENQLISLFEGTQLLGTTSTNSDGYAQFSWAITLPLGTHSFYLETTETSIHESWISANLDYLVHDIPQIAIANYSSSLFAGETLSLDVQVTSSGSNTTNGMASLFWDDIWQTDFIIEDGLATIDYNTSITDSPGNHTLTIMFGHLDDPDYYAMKAASITITLKPVFPTHLALILTPPETTATVPPNQIEINLRLTYLNRTTNYGLTGNVIVQILAVNGTTIDLLNSTTNQEGYLHWTIESPKPGEYEIIADFLGSPGYAASSQRNTLQVHPPLYQEPFIIPPLLLISIIIILGGLILGAFFYLRLAGRTNRLVNRLLQGNTRSSQLLPTSPLPHPTTGLQSQLSESLSSSMVAPTEPLSSSSESNSRGSNQHSSPQQEEREE